MFVIVAKLVPLLHNYSKKKKQGFNVKFKNKIKLKKQTNKKKKQGRWGLCPPSSFVILPAKLLFRDLEY